jgi:hypothetical protein
MEEAFERLSDMYSIEVQAMPPALAHCAIPCCLELGDIGQYLHVYFFSLGCNSSTSL